jgi:magnesium-transporting ATPase (P-type)
LFTFLSFSFEHAGLSGVGWLVSDSFRLWTSFHHALFWPTILSWPLALAIYSTPISFFLGSGHMYYVGFRLFAAPSFWLALPIIIIAGLLPDLSWRAFRRNFRPRGFHIVSELYSFKEDPDLHQYVISLLVLVV